LIESISTIEVIPTIAFWCLLALATWGMVDLMNRLSFWGEHQIKQLIKRWKP
jgi:hypothetical protein